MSTFSRHLGRRCIEVAGEIYAREFHRLDVLTPCPIPASGPAILVCNHTSALDPVMIQAAVPRFITWMMAREYFEMASMRWAFELLETIPVDRENRDTLATRAALKALHDGKLLGIFPEGRIETARELLPFHAGVAMLARRGNAAVFPAYLDGSQRGSTMTDVFKHRQHVKLRFGPAVTSAEDLNIVRIKNSIEKLQTAAAS